MIMAETGIGIVGLGGFGVFCLEAFAAMPEITVAAAADSDPHRIAIAEEFGASAYTCYEDLLADPGVQIVAINTPPHMHAGMAIEGARAGKHLFVEKPLATSLDDARKVIQAAHEAGVFLTVDYVLRFHPLHQLALKIVRGGAFGPLQHFSLENFATDDALLPDHWFWDAATGVAEFMSSMAYTFSTSATSLQAAEPTSPLGPPRRAPMAAWTGSAQHCAMGRMYWRPFTTVSTRSGAQKRRLSGSPARVGI